MAVDWHVANDETWRFSCPIPSPPLPPHKKFQFAFGDKAVEQLDEMTVQLGCSRAEVVRYGLSLLRQAIIWEQEGASIARHNADGTFMDVELKPGSVKTIDN